jgi:hypothetical protein
MKMSSAHGRILDALRDMGLNPNYLRKVIIEIDTISPIKVHIEQLGDESVLGVMKAIDGDLQVIREAKEVNDG